MHLCLSTLPFIIKCNQTYNTSKFKHTDVKALKKFLVLKIFPQLEMHHTEKN